MISGRDENMSVKARAGSLHLLYGVRPDLRRVKEVSRQKRDRTAPLAGQHKHSAHELQLLFPPLRRLRGRKTGKRRVQMQVRRV